MIFAIAFPCAFLLVLLIMAFANRPKPGDGTCESSNQVLARWVKQSKAAKLEKRGGAIALLVFMLAIIAFISSLVIFPFVLDMSMEEMCKKVLPLLFAVCLGAVMLVGLITVSLGANSFFDLARWLAKEKTNFYTVLKKGGGNKRGAFVLGSGLLLKESPKTKNIFYTRILITALLTLLFPLSAYLFAKAAIAEMITMLYARHSPSVGDILLTPEAFFFCGVFLFLIISGALINSTITRKQKALLVQHGIGKEKKK